MIQGRIEQAVILAGGLGTRMHPFTLHHPKPMYPFNGIPFIDYLIRQVRDFGIKKILLLLGYMPEQIQEYLGNGEKYGLEIMYDVTPVEYDTGNRLKAAEQKLCTEFLLMYCDNYCPIDYERLYADFCKNEAEIQISVYANKDNYTKNNLKLDANGKVLCYDKTRTTEGLQGVDIGYVIVRKRTLDYLKKDTAVTANFEKIVYEQMVQKGKLFATLTEHRYYSVGSWERIKLTEQFFDNQPTIFLDRDGTLNQRPPKACYVEKSEEFIWLEGAKEAVRLLKESGYRVILVSNQPGIARGNLTEETLEQIHRKMQEDLEKETGHQIDAIYYCPHNWDDGCECRKPRPGMLYQAQKDFSLNLRDCVLIGDDERDIEAGEAAGCRSILVNDEYDLLNAVQDLLYKE